MPDLFVIAGPNGVGKTTYAKRFLPEFAQCLEFLNADLIAKGIAPFEPEKASIRAGRIMLQRVYELVEEEKSFAFETTLSGRGFVALLERARSHGYTVYLDFLWVTELRTSSDRVAQRVVKGGHDISREIQERRFTLGLQNLFELYRPLINQWRIFDNSGLSPRCIAHEKDGILTVLSQNDFDRLPLRGEKGTMDDSSSTGIVAEPSKWYGDIQSATIDAMRAMNLAFADVVLENHRLGLPVIQMRDGKVAHVPAEELLDQAHRFLATNGEPLPEQFGR